MSDMADKGGEGSEWAVDFALYSRPPSAVSPALRRAWFDRADQVTPSAGYSRATTPIVAATF